MKKSSIRCSLAATIFLMLALAGCGGTSSNSNPGGSDGGSSGAVDDPVAWQQVGTQASAPDAESQDPVMLLSTPRVGYRHSSYQIALNQWDETSWGVSKSDPSNGNYETFYGPPNFCSDGSTIYAAFAHSGVASSSGSDFYDHVLAYSWDDTNGWQAMNGGNEISNTWPGNQWDAYEPTIVCQSIDISDQGDPSGDDQSLASKQTAQHDYDVVIAWVEADNATATDNVYVGLVGQTASSISAPISRNEAVGSFQTDVRLSGLTADASNAYVAQWENDAFDQYKTELYVTQVSLPGFAQTDLGSAIDVDYNGNDISTPALALYGGDLVVAYSAFRPCPGTTTNIRDIYVQRWNGSAWAEMGTGPVSAYTSATHLDSNNPSLIVASNVLYLAWDEEGGEGSSINVARWDAASNAWVLSDANTRISRDVATNTLDPSLGYDSSTSTLYVAFEAMISGWPQIAVMKKALTAPTSN